WQANMDLLDSDEFNLDDAEWPILSKSALKQPHFLGGQAEIYNSLITEGCYINGVVKHSVIADSVEIEKGAKVVDCVIMSGAKVLAGAQVFKTIIGEGAIIGEGCVVGVGGGEEGTSKYVSPYCSGGVSLVAPGARVTEKWIVSNSMITEDKGGKQ
ncbi:MAG: hypothetical protein IJE92_05610, partial [Clostridia bacterium]|nr:hypothetical protein [Clostridia bacterium]